MIALHLDNYQSLSIIGLSKNAGKTTVLNALSSMYWEKYALGLVSAGVDGEKHDAWSHLHKPSVNVFRGMTVATAGVSIDEAPGDWDVMAYVGEHTVIGPLFIARAMRNTVVKLTGISSTSVLLKALSALKQCGVGRILVDGAYDRKASSSPALTEGIVLVVGASMSDSYEKVFSKAEEILHCFSLPQTVYKEVGYRALYEQKIVLSRDGEMKVLPISSLILNSHRRRSFFQSVIEEKADGIALPGAVTDKMVQTLIEQKIFVCLVVADATRVFVSKTLLDLYRKKGGNVEVVNKSTLVTVAMNPTSVEGYWFDAARMKEDLRRICKGIPVVDVVRECVVT